MRDVLSMPKVHLHVHLESAVRDRTLAEIAAGHGEPVPPPHRGTGVAALSAAGGAVRDLLRSPDDFRRVARELIEDEAATGTRYVEVTFTAASHGERLGDLDMPLRAVLDGLEEGADETGVEHGVILDHPRRRSVERAWQTLDLAHRHSDRAVVAIGVAGQEAHSIAPFGHVFAAAEWRGVHRVHHAGEECGPDSIREALTTGRADRIGHGITALDDVDLVTELRSQGVPLEVSRRPTSRLGWLRASPSIRSSHCGTPASSSP